MESMLVGFRPPNYQVHSCQPWKRFRFNLAAKQQQSFILQKQIKQKITRPYSHDPQLMTPQILEMSPVRTVSPTWAFKYPSSLSWLMLISCPIRTKQYSDFAACI
jgi:hypothetical protein